VPNALLHGVDAPTGLLLGSMVAIDGCAFDSREWAMAMCFGAAMLTNSVE